MHVIDQYTLFYPKQTTGRLELLNIVYESTSTQITDKNKNTFQYN